MFTQALNAYLAGDTRTGSGCTLMEICRAVLDSVAKVKDPASGMDFLPLDVERALNLEKNRNLRQQ
jgi:hypothetical protein